MCTNFQWDGGYGDLTFPHTAHPSSPAVQPGPAAGEARDWSAAEAVATEDAWSRTNTVTLSYRFAKGSQSPGSALASEAQPRPSPATRPAYGPGARSLFASNLPPLKSSRTVNFHPEQRDNGKLLTAAGPLGWGLVGWAELAGLALAYSAQCAQCTARGQRGLAMPARQSS